MEKNYGLINRFSFKYDHFYFVDTTEYLADRIFIRRKINVKMGDEYGSDQSDYVIVFCKVRKKDRERFQEAMKELEQKMLILGHRDYIDFCGRLQIKKAS